MDTLTKLLNTINIPVWINQNNNIIFTNDTYRNLIEKENEKTYIQIKSIAKDKTIGYFENINIGDEIYSKLVIPIDSKDTLLGLLIKKEKVNYTDAFNLLINSIPELIFCKDNDLNYTIINKECEKFYKSRGLNEIIGKTDLDFNLDKEFLQTCTENDKLVLETRKPLYMEEEVPVPNSDEIKVYQTMKAPVIDEIGNIHGLIGIVREISKQKKIEEKLRYLSYRDILTGLYNRTYFNEKISEILMKEDFQVGVIVGDLNGLKIVNDIYGHLEGDKLIKAASKILINASGENGYVFRWGGDEFITLLMDASEEDCKNYIDNINKMCKKTSHKNKSISISQGYAIFNSENNEIDKVIKEADKMLYDNKNLNRSQVAREMIYRSIQSLDEKGIESKKHISSVLEMAMKIGKAMKLDCRELEKLRLLALLHDIGKLAIEDNILLRKGPLSEEEYMIVKNHSKLGYKIATMTPEISHIAKEILHHHERWDGKGYPNGLIGNEIPLLSRIINIVDSFDRMINGTVYKNKLNKEDAILELKRNSGTQFDPNIVSVFLEIIRSEYDEE